MASNIQPSWSALKKKDMRKHRRYTVDNATLRVSWLDSKSQLKMAHARVLNICERGMALELPEAPMMNTMVRFQSEKHKLVGSGGIRHCRKVGSKYIVGIEFGEGLRWMPPPDDVEEPIPLFGPDA